MSERRSASLRFTWLFLPVLLLSLTACVSTPQSSILLQSAAERQTTSALIPDIAFFPQEAWQCGPAALATLLSATGVHVLPDDLVPLVYVPDLKGSLQPEMLAAARSFERLVYPVPQTLEAVFDEIDAGNPVLVLQNLGLAIYPKWHFAVVKGYDLGRREIILNSGAIENYRVAMRTFERSWRRGDYWGFVALTPGTLPANAQADAYFQALVPLLDRIGMAEGNRAIDAGLARWPDDRNLLMSSGNQLYALGRHPAAAAMFEKVTQHYPDYAPAYNNLAHVQTGLELYDEALHNISRALELDTSRLESYRATQQRLLSLMQR